MRAPAHSTRGARGRWARAAEARPAPEGHVVRGQLPVPWSCLSPAQGRPPRARRPEDGTASEGRASASELRFRSVIVKGPCPVGRQLPGPERKGMGCGPRDYLGKKEGALVEAEWLGATAHRWVGVRPVDPWPGTHQAVGSIPGQRVWKATAQCLSLTWTFPSSSPPSFLK